MGSAILFFSMCTATHNERTVFLESLFQNEEVYDLFQFRMMHLLVH